MYVMRTDARLDGIGSEPSVREHLHEMTPAEFKEARRAEEETREADEARLGFMPVHHRRVGAAEAHEHVRSGRIHSTHLYVDGGRVRANRER